MTKSKVLSWCIAISVMALIVSNIITNKQFSLFGYATTCATFLIPFTYICNDVVAEVFGFKTARNVTLLAFLMGFIAAMLFQFTVWVPGVETFALQDQFDAVLSNVPRTMFASFLAFIVGSLSNAKIMQIMHDNDGEKRLGFRCILSTVVGETLDMGIFTFIAFTGILPIEVMSQVLITGVILKSLWETVVYVLATRHVIHWVKTLED